jgi:hypothetical protein
MEALPKEILDISLVEELLILKKEKLFFVFGLFGFIFESLMSLMLFFLSLFLPVNVLSFCLFSFSS